MDKGSQRVQCHHLGLWAKIQVFVRYNVRGPTWNIIKASPEWHRTHKPSSHALCHIVLLLHLLHKESPQTHLLANEQKHIARTTRTHKHKHHFVAGCVFTDHHHIILSYM